MLRGGFAPWIEFAERIRPVSHRLPPFRADDDDPDDAPETEEKKTGAAAAPVNELESRLFKGRKVMVFGEINDKIARDVVARILTLAEESTKPIDVFVSSPGGHVESGDTIHDIIKFVRDTVPVRLIGTGWVASAGAHIYLAGEKKRRFCLPNTRFLLHQPTGGVRGQATDIDIEAREIIKMRERLSQVIAAETGQPIERVRKDCERNYWMSASEAVTYGLVSQVISTVVELE